MSEFVHVKGLAELQKFLDTLPAKMEANVMRSALRAGANVVKDEAKNNVPVKSGLLRDGLKVSTRSRKGVVTASVKATGKHAFIAKWIEFGTAAHRIVPKKAKSLFFGGIFAEGVDHPGSSAKPFLRPALDNRAQEATVAVGNQIKKRLTKAGIEGAGAVDIETL
jgi:HK97 gp10 family phage protein